MDELRQLEDDVAAAAEAVCPGVGCQTVRLWALPMSSPAPIGAGYTNVSHLADGMDAWRAACRAVLDRP